MTKEQALALARARRRKAEAAQAPAPAQTVQPSQPTQLARNLAQNPAARRQYAQRMQQEAFGAPSLWPAAQAIGATSPHPIAQQVGAQDLLKAPPEAQDLGMAWSPVDLLGATAAAGLTTKALATKTKKTAKDFFDDLVTPYRSRKQQIAQELRGANKSRTGTYTFKLSGSEKAQKEVLKSVEGISPMKNLRDNLNVVNKEIRQSGSKLQSQLMKSKSVITDAELENALRRQFSDYLNTLEGLEFAGKDELVDSAIQKVIAAYRKQSSNPAGLWAARKEVDRVFQRLNGARRYQAVVGNVDLKPTDAELIWDNSRKAMLELLEQKAPGTRNEMRRLSLLYDARQTMAEKAPDVGTTLTKRIKEKVPFMGDKSISLKPRNWLQ